MDYAKSVTRTFGYSPYSQDLQHPGDRRRIARWAQLTGNQLELVNFWAKDAVVFSEATSFHVIRKCKGYRVYDLIDPYFVADNIGIDLFRSIGKRIIQRDFSEKFRYTESVKNVCKEVDAVICSSPEQADYINKYNRNVHVILDFHSEIPELTLSNRQEAEFSILWEGQAATLDALLKLSEVFEHCRQRFTSVRLFLVTDLRKYRFNNRYFGKDTESFANKLSRDSDLKITLLPWSVENLKNAAKQSNLAVIPVDLTRKSQILKPENRLLIMWRLGLFAIASATPAHLRVQNMLGVPFACKNIKDWTNAIDQFSREKSNLNDFSIRSREYLLTNHNDDLLVSKWNNVFS